MTPRQVRRNTEWLLDWEAAVMYWEQQQTIAKTPEQVEALEFCKQHAVDHIRWLLA